VSALWIPTIAGAILVVAIVASAGKEKACAPGEYLVRAYSPWKEICVVGREQ